MKNNPLTDEYSRYGAFDALAELNNTQLRGLVEKLTATEQEKGSVAQKVADMYKLVMDSVRLNKEGAEPIKADFAAIDAVADKAQYFKTVAEMSMTSASVFFRYGIDADMKSSKENLFDLSQGGLSLGQKDYYVENDSATADVRNKFQEHIVNMFKLVGDDEAQARLVCRMSCVLRPVWQRLL